MIREEVPTSFNMVTWRALMLISSLNFSAKRQETYWLNRSLVHVSDISWMAVKMAQSAHTFVSLRIENSNYAYGISLKINFQDISIITHDWNVLWVEFSKVAFQFTISIWDFTKFSFMFESNDFFRFFPKKTSCNHMSHWAPLSLNMQVNI